MANCKNTQQLNITCGTDVVLKDTLMFDGEIFDPDLSSDIEVNLVNSLGKRTSLNFEIDSQQLVIDLEWDDNRNAGCYGLEVKGVCNERRWSTYADGLIRYTRATKEGDINVDVESDEREVTQVVGFRYSDSPIDEVDISIDGGYGTPTADAEYEHRKLTLGFHDLRGEKGDKGDKGDQGIAGESAVFDPTTGNIADIKQTTGESTTSPMSQAAITEIVETEVTETIVIDGASNCSNGSFIKNGTDELGSDGSAGWIKVCYQIPTLTSKDKLVFRDMYSRQNGVADSIFFYDSEQQFISSVYLAQHSNYELTIENIPEGAVYARWNYYWATYHGRTRFNLLKVSRTDRMGVIENTLANRKLYSGTGQKTDGSMTQKATSDALEARQAADAQKVPANYTVGKDGAGNTNANCALPTAMIPVVVDGNYYYLFGVLNGGKTRTYDSEGIYRSSDTSSNSTQTGKSSKMVHDGTAYILVDFDINRIDEAAIWHNGELVWKATPIVDLSDVNSQVIAHQEDIDNDLVEVPDHYKTYIQDKCATIFRKDCLYKGNGDSFIFLTDHHLPDAGTLPNSCSQYRHSAALVRYIQRHTETKRFVFGGDITCSPSNDNVRLIRHRWFTEDFRNTNMMPVIGNHEWQNSDAADYTKGGNKFERNKRDFGQFCTNLNQYGAVFDTHKLPYYYWDNQATKIRYFAMYAPAADDITGGSTPDNIFLEDWQLPFLQAKAAELDNTWSIVVFQHIVGTSAKNATFDENGEPLSMGHHSVGNKTIAVLNAIQIDQTKPRVRALVTGHTHFDFVEFSSQGIPTIVTTCDATYHWVWNGNKWLDQLYPNNDVRLPNSTNEQAFDIMHLDLDGDKWDLTRIGYGRNRIIRLTAVTVAVDETVEITPTISPISGDELSYEMRDTGKATVESGMVTGVTTGRTVLKIANAANYEDQTAWEYINIVVTA